jgi:hypothetical protein
MEWASLLLPFADVQVVLQNLNSGVDEHMLEGNDLFKKAFRLPFCAESHYPFNPRSIVPAAIEQDHFLRCWQMPDVTLKIPRCALTVGWLTKSDNAGLTRAEMFDNTLNGSVLAGCVSTFKFDQHLVAMLNDVALKLDELDLKATKCGLVARTPMRIARSLVVLRHGDCSSGYNISGRCSYIQQGLEFPVDALLASGNKTLAHSCPP